MYLLHGFIKTTPKTPPPIWRWLKNAGSRSSHDD
jgi:hypothetical protein